MTPGDGVIARLAAVNEITMDLLQKWPMLSDAEKEQTMIRIHHDLANILTLTQGWHDLAEERRAYHEEEGKGKL